MTTLPEEFIQYTKTLMGEEKWQQFMSAFTQTPPVSIRLNPFKTDEHTKEIILRDKTISTPIAWCENAFMLSERPNFTADPLLHAGCYYVQEAGSMFLDRVIRQYVHHPVKFLDLCAAPGGKSTLARAALPENSVLYANEPDRHRANILTENIQKQGHPDVIVTNNYAADYAREKMMFDVILTDVPCSGEGMFRKDEGAIKEWSIQNVLKCQELQRNIIKDIWQCLTPGGLLIYSTCTFNTREDEENVLWIMNEMGAEILSVDTESDWNITGSLLKGYASLPVYRFIPGITPTEGLFMAVLRKPGEYKPVLEKKEKVREKKGKKVKEERTSLHIMHQKGMSTAEPANETNKKGREADIRKKGKGKEAAVPPHYEALLYNLAEDAYPRVNLSLTEALTYLRRESLVLSPDVTRGIILVCYEGHPLGFVKNIGNRASNLYPQEWKIRKRT